MTQQRDYLIIGQGLAGSALAWELMQRGRTVVVYDQPDTNRSSAIAAGLFNPITGRVMTRTWKADEIFPALLKFYGQAEQVLNKRFLHELPIYRPFLSQEERTQWQAKSESPDLKRFVKAFREAGAFAHQAHDPFGGIEVANSGYLDVNQWMLAVREYLLIRDSYMHEAFLEEDLLVNELIRYKNHTAKKIIFCNGLQALDTRWFGWLPLRKLKGEVIDVTLSVVPERIYNHGAYLVPYGKESRWRVGATYEHSPFSECATAESREALEAKLQALIRLPYEIIHQDWGIRPTTPDRRPMLGAHPSNKNVLIFNGLGTKGVSLAPYFACQLADWLECKGDLPAEVNINRFKALYSG